MSDVILNFVGDTSGLQAIGDYLDQLIAKEGKIAEQWKVVMSQMSGATNASVQSNTKLADSISDVAASQKEVAEQTGKTSTAFDNQNKTNIDGSNKLAKSIDGLVTASKTLDKSIIGGAYKQYLQEIQQQLGLTKNELVKYIQNARQAAQAAIFTSANDQEVKELTLSIGVMNAQLKQLGVNEDSASARSQNFQTQLRGLANEIKGIQVAVNNGTATTEQVAQLDTLTNKYTELAKVQKQFQIESKGLVSNDERISGTISLLSGVAGGYAAVQGAATLFGEKSDDVAQALLKLNAVMAIANGLQTLATTLQKSSAGSILLQKLGFDAQTKSIDENTASIERNDLAKAGTKVENPVVSKVSQQVQGSKSDVDNSAATINAANSAKQKAAATNLDTTSTSANTEAQITNTEAKNVGTVSSGELSAATDIEADSSKGAIIGKEGLADADIALSEAEGIATTTTVGLTTALLANPVTAALVGIFALVEAFKFLGSETLEETDRQRKLADALKEATTYFDLETKSNKLGTDLILAQDKLAGASAVELSKVRGDAAKRDLDNLQVHREELAKSIQEGQDTINALEAQGKSPDKKLLEAQKSLEDEKLKLDIKYNEDAIALQTQLADHQKIINDSILRSIIEFNNNKVALTIAGSDAERIAQINEIKATQDARIKLAIDGLGTIAEQTAIKNNIIAEDEKQIHGLQLQNLQHYLKGRTDAVAAEIAIEQQLQARSDEDAIGQIKKISDLQIEAINKQKNEALSNPTLNQKERENITEQADLNIFENQKRLQLEIVNIQKQTINERLEAANKGSYDESIYKLALIENDRDAELASAGKNLDLINAINAKYNKAEEDLRKTQASTLLQDDINFNTAQLNSFKLTEQSKLYFTLANIADEKQKEILASDQKASTINAIEAKYNYQALQARLASIDTVKNKEIESLQIQQEQYLKLQQNIANSQFSPIGDKVNALQNLQKEKDAELAIQKKALEDQRDLELKSVGDDVEAQAVIYKNFNDKFQDIENKKRDIAEATEKAITDAELKEIDKRLDKIKSISTLFENSLSSLFPTQDAFSTALSQLNIFGVAAYGIFEKLKVQVKQYNDLIAKGNAPDATDDDKAKGEQAAIDKQAAQEKASADIRVGIAEVAQATINQLYADSAAQRQQELTDELNALEDQKNTELNNASLTAKQKDAINKEFAAKERQAKIKAFEADKRAKVTQAIINGILAGTAALPNFILAGIAVAASLIAAAKISSQPTPKFRHGEVDIDTSKWHPTYTGKIDIQGPGTSTSDSIAAWISKGETVTSAEKTRKHKDVLTMVHDDTFETHYLKKNDVVSTWKQTMEAMDNDTYQGYITQKFKEHRFPDMQGSVLYATHNHFHQNTTQSIDYKQLAIEVGKEVAKQMKGVIPDPKSVHVNVDKDGIHTIVQEANTRTEWKNKRYSSRP